MQSWSLDEKIKASQAKIIEFGLHFQDKIYVSFSGGKDSTVLLDLVRRVYPDCPAVFVDTGLEYPEIREFVKSVPNVTWLKPKKNFKQVILEYGYPLISKEVSQKIYESRSKPDGYATKRFDADGEYATKYGGRFSMVKWKWLRDSDIPISNRCCYVMKKQPAKAFEKSSGLHPIVGTMAAESALRKTNWLRNGCNAFESTRPISQPISFWTEQDILEYISRFNLPYASVYGDIVRTSRGKYTTTGAKRTGCIYCGFGISQDGCPNRFQRLKQTHPKIWEYCMKPVEDGGLGMKHVLEYIDVPIE